MIDADRALDYLGFVEGRHRAWVGRQHGDTQPWTSEPYVQAYKFTNVFRILDHGTQFIMTDLLADGPSERDLLMRLFLYRHTGRTEVWRHLLGDLGGYPTVDDLDDTLASWQDYRGETKVTQRGREARNAPGEKRVFTKSVFTGAYLVFPQSAERGTDKLESIVKLTQRLFQPGSPDDVVPSFLSARDQRERFATLRRNKGVADFMSMQILTDWGYTPYADGDREDEYVVLGPGARRGAQALDPTGSVDKTLLWAVDAVRSSPHCPEIETPSGATRKPSYMDVQNTLCEFSKWVRFSQKPLPTKQYRPAHPGQQPAPVLPEHW